MRTPLTIPRICNPIAVIQPHFFNFNKPTAAIIWNTAQEHTIKAAFHPETNTPRKQNGSSWPENMVFANRRPNGVSTALTRKNQPIIVILRGLAPGRRSANLTVGPSVGSATN